MKEKAPKEEAPVEKREKRERFRFAVRFFESRDHPSFTEDTFLSEHELGLAAVFDGLGGQSAGRVASGAARDSVREGVALWDAVTDEDAQEGMVQNSLKSVLTTAGRAVVDRGHEAYLRASDEEKQKWRSPETTASVVKLHEFEDGRLAAFVANLGDSRVYVRRADGTVELVTTDHDILSDPDYVAMLEDKFQRDITEPDIARYRALLDDADGEAAMPDEFGKALFRMRNVMRAALGLGVSLPARTSEVFLSPGDMLFITSDGVHDNLRRERINAIAANAKSADELADLLASEARAYAQQAPTKAEFKQMAADNRPLPRHKADDITVVVVEAQ